MKMRSILLKKIDSPKKCILRLIPNLTTNPTDNMKLAKRITLTATLGLVAASSLQAAMPTQEEMWKIIQEQQKQIAELKAMTENNQSAVSAAQAESASAKAEATQVKSQLSQTQAQLEATTLAVEEAGSSASSGWWEQTSIGGYGELHANYPEDGDNTIDFHRFVLFVNHEFNDWITLYSELEVEHTVVEGGNGAVELEQAFLRMDWADNFSTDVGIFLLPIGITNETHEPNTFYGVERNGVESKIIPSTWWEGGIKGTYQFENGLAVDAAVTSGLNASDGNIRGGRGQVAEVPNNEAAFTSRVKYTGIAGLEVAASVFYQDNLNQSSSDPEVSGLLSEAHVDYSYEGFRLRALYARWDLDGTTDSAAEEQYGYYIEPSYRWNLSEKYGDLGVYARYSEFEYYDGSSLNDNEIYEFGLNYWPTANVVFKADYQAVVDDSDAFNLGLGYQF